MAKNILKIVFALFFIAAPGLISNSLAVGMGMGGGMGMGPPTPCGGPFPPCPVPLDGAIMLLLLAGILYGSKKIYDSLKKNPA